MYPQRRHFIKCFKYLWKYELKLKNAYIIDEKVACLRWIDEGDLS